MSQLSAGVSSGRTRLATSRSVRRPRRARPRVVERTASAPAGPRLGDQPYDGVPVGDDEPRRRRVPGPSGRPPRTAPRRAWGRRRAGRGRGAGRGPPAARAGGDGAGSGAVPRAGRAARGARRGREVDDEEFVVIGALGEGGVAQGTQQGEFVGAGQGGEFLGVEAAGAEQVERGGGAFLEGGEVVPEPLRGVGPPGGEAGFDGDRCGAARGHPEHGAEGVVAVGAEEQGAGALPGGGERGGGGDGGTAAAAGARDQDGAHGGERYRCLGGTGCGCLPGVRSPGSWAPHGMAQPGAAGCRCAHPCRPAARLPAAAATSVPTPPRFFRPARARSMMTFSALRLISAQHRDLDVDREPVGDLRARAGRAEQVGAVQGAQHLGLHQRPGHLVLAGPGVAQRLVVLDRPGVHDESDLLGTAPRVGREDLRLLHPHRSSPGSEAKSAITAMTSAGAASIVMLELVCSAIAVAPPDAGRY